MPRFVQKYLLQVQLIVPFIQRCVPFHSVLGLETKLFENVLHSGLFQQRSFDVVLLVGAAELLENADVTTSIFCIQEHILGSLEIMRGHFDCVILLSELEYRNLNVAASSCGPGHFFFWLNGDGFSTISGFGWTQLNEVIDVNKRS